MNKRQRKKQAKKLLAVFESLAAQLPYVIRGFELVTRCGVNTAEALRRLQMQRY
jgi:hypothetical protein